MSFPHLTSPMVCQLNSVPFYVCCGEMEMKHFTLVYIR